LGYRPFVSTDADVAHAGGEPIHELRLGLTWAFSFGKER
jgi:hypothetical protein